ncbi:MAG: hypothetical protein IPJ27_23740 [Candidatus Accumulibacter sp.]|uniref:Uncharacterized protein n=1 Tax=Candidatus Accumulibacter proximus TaxID=2954385 RepID=A0A935UHW6_9PROT|nr:hypothetical protein [Candidatus Accumulibacter proximus]
MTAPAAARFAFTSAPASPAGRPRPGGGGGGPPRGGGGGGGGGGGENASETCSTIMD